MVERRATGSLESAVLECLWEADGPQTPSQVLTSLGDGLAYTTVMTILVRLWQKGLAERERVGRAFAYRAKVTEAELVAGRMRTALSQASDRSTTLSSFVGGLSRREVAVLRAALEDTGP